MTDVTLKVKTKSGEQIIRGLTSNNTLADLKQKIGPSCHSLMSGYPPRPLQGDCKTLSELGIKSGDTLIVQESPAATSAVDDAASASVEDSGVVEPQPATTPRRHVQDEDGAMNGLLMRQVVPSDNSCLFTSVGFVLSGSVDVTCGTHMRKIIAEQVSQDGERYSEAILGQPNNNYCAWIQKPDTWGGAIELAVLSEFYDVEIAVVDTINAVINRFGEDKAYPYRAFLIFDGIHYDPLYKEQPDGSIQTMFPSSNEKVLHEAAELAKEAKSSRQYTDVARFTIRCLVCRVELIGEAQAQKHAQQTGHLNFGEVAS